MARLRDRVVKRTAKIETTVGTDAVPTGTEFFRSLAGQVPSLNFDITDNPESRGGLGSGEHTVGSPRPSIPIRATARGSGTENLPPDVAALLIVCGWVESINTALAAATASAGTTTGLTFPHGGVWPSSTAAGQALLGHPVVLGGTLPAPFTGLAPSDFIKSYSVTGADVTVGLGTTYGGGGLGADATITRPACVTYKTGTPSPHPALSLWEYIDGLLQKFLGTRGTWATTWEANKQGIFDFVLSGFYGGRTDVALLTGETDDPASGQPFTNGICHIDNVAVCVNAITASLNNTGYFPNCPSATQGIDAYEITGRDVRLELDPDLTTVAAGDFVSKLALGTISFVCAMLGPRVGGTAGTRIGLSMHDAKLRSVTDAIDNGNRKVRCEYGSRLVDGEFTLAIW